MAYTPKDWRDLPDHSTPITAAALEDLETRVTDYADTLPLGDTFNNTYNVTLEPGAAVDVGIDVWTSEADPGAVTDWGPIVSALITGGARQLLFSGHAFPFHTQIQLDVPGLVFRGDRSAIRNTADTDQPRLVWTGGVGSGNAIRFISSAATSTEFHNLGIQYSDDAYDGTLVWIKPTSDQAGWNLFRGCQIGGRSAATELSASAFCGIACPQGPYTRVENCQFRSLQWGMRGFEADGSGNQHPDDCSVIGSSFFHCEQAAIGNVGKFWEIDNNVVYGSALDDITYITRAFMDDDHTVAESSRNPQFTATNNRAWDIHNDQEFTFFHQSVNETWDAVILRNFQAGTSPTQTMIQLDGPGSVVIEDNLFERFHGVGDDPIIDCGDYTTALKTHLVVHNNSLSTSAPGEAIANVANHKGVEVYGNGNEITRVSHEAAAWLSNADADKGLAISNKNAAAENLEVQGNDAGGVIIMDVRGTFNPGDKIADLAFRVVDILPGVSWSMTGGRKPAVVLSPVAIAGQTTDIMDAYPSLTVDSQDGFALYANATLSYPAGGGKVAWAYRVLQT